MADEITITKGDTPTLRVTVQDSNGAFDISGYTPILTVRTTKDASSALLTKVGSIVVAAEGTINFTLLDTDTDIEPGTYFYDVEINNGTKIYTVINSFFTVTGDVTRT